MREIGQQGRQIGIEQTIAVAQQEPLIQMRRGMAQRARRTGRERLLGKNQPGRLRQRCRGILHGVLHRLAQMRGQDNELLHAPALQLPHQPSQKRTIADFQHWLGYFAGDGAEARGETAR